MIRRAGLPRVLLAGILFIGLSLGAVAALVKVKREIFNDDAQAAPRSCSEAGPQNIHDPRHPRAPAGSWHTIAASPLARAELGSVVLGGRIYLAGGQVANGRSTAAVISYEPATGRYRDEPPMPARLDHELLVTDGRDLYVAGGYTDGDPVNSAFRYSPATRRWEALPSMHVARGGLGGGIVGGRLYAAGGAPRTYPDQRVAADNTLEVLDLATRRWSFGPSLPHARHHVGHATVAGAIYIIGGRVRDEFAIARVDRFDPRANRWRSAAALPQEVASPLVGKTATGFVAAGGADPALWEEQGRGWVTPATWRYDARKDSWRRLPDLAEPRHQGGAAIVGRSMYVFEGSPCPGFGRMREAERLRIR